MTVDTKRTYVYTIDGRIYARVRAVCWDSAWDMLKRRMANMGYAALRQHVRPTEYGVDT